MRIDKIILGLLIIISFISLPSKAQVCSPNYDNPWEWASHATWFTGDGVFINFPDGTGAPVISTKAVDLGTNTNHAYEGTAAFSDNAGTLIGWSNGRKLWREDGADGILVASDMVAGNEGGSVGERSSAVQGIVAVRHPNIPEKIFIFTSDDVLSGTIGMHYTVYDIITQTSTAPIRLQNDVGGDYRGTEQIDATFHANGNDIWVVVRQSGRGTFNNFRSFYSYSITCNGINPVPIKSQDVVPQLGHTYAGGGGNFQAGMWSNDYGRGALKISWDGTKAATGNHITGGSDADEALMVFDFDNATGLLSNAVPFARVPGDWGWDNAFTNWGAAYDIEWAPDSRGLYISSISGGGDLQWFDTQAGSGSAINSSGKLIYNSHRQFTDIKLGGDGKLYAPGLGQNLNQYSFPSLNDLNNGNGMSFSSIATGRAVSLGLSNTFIPPIDYTDLSGNSTTMDCTDPPYDLGVVWLCRGGSAEDNTVDGWSSDCGACITDAANGIFDPSIAGVGTHKVYYQRGVTCSQIDSIEIAVTCSINPCEDTTLSNVVTPICVNQAADLTAFEVTSDPGTWSIVSNPAGTNPAVITGGNTFDATGSADAGVYRIRFSLTSVPTGACPDSSERNIIVNALPVPTITGNTIVCEDSTTLITGVAGSGGTLAWSGITPSTNPLAVTSAGTYTIIETDPNGCVDSVDHVVTLEDLPSVDLGGPYTFCFSQGNELLDAFSGGANETYLWSNASTASTLDVTDSSIVSVIVTSENGCMAYDTAIIDTFSLPKVELGNDAFYCKASSIVLDAGAFDSWVWTPNGETTQKITVTVEGTYGVTVTDENGCENTDQIIITEKELPTIDLGPDTTVCEADSIPLDATHNDAVSYSWTPNSENTPTIKIGSTDGTFGVTITDNNGCVFTASITIKQEDLPIVNLGLNDTICDDLKKTLNAGAGLQQAYTWYLNDAVIENETSQTFAADSGTYIVSVKTPFGCETKDTIEIDNYQLPVVVLTSSHEFCELDSVNLDAGNPTATFNWVPGNKTDQTIWANSDTTYTVTVTDTNGCINEGSSVVSENPKPIPGLGLNSAACIGLETQLDATVPNGVTYIWSTTSTTGIHDKATYSFTGPDTVSVIVTDSKGCIGYDTLEIRSLDSLNIQFGDTALECENDIQALDPGDFQGASYTWTLPNGSTDYNQSIVPNEIGWHVINVIDQFNCKGLDSIYIVIIPLPNINLGPDTVFCSYGQDVYTIRMEFDQKVTGTIDWNDGGDNNNSNDTLFSATYAPSTVIGQFIDNSTGCTHRDSVQLTEFCEPTLCGFPNIFSPGGTSNRDFHLLCVEDSNYVKIANNIVSSEFEVYNRWGLKVFQSENLLPRWNGVYENRPVASGTYFWVYKYKDTSLKEYRMNGFVQVIQMM